MSTIGPVKAFSATINTASTYTSAIDLGGSYAKIGLSIPTMASGSFYVQVSDEESGTFRRLYHKPVAGTTTPPVVLIDSSVTNCVVPLEIPAQYMKVEISTITSDSSGVFKVICSS